MAKKKVAAKPKRKLKPQAAKQAIKTKGPGVKARKTAERGEMAAQNGREPKAGQRIGRTGALEEETLDRDAPYNKTYGLSRKK